MTSFACDGVLFDCDGVLVDSDASVISAWSRWARDRGLDPDEVVSVVHGRRSADTVALLVPAADRATALAQINRYEVDDARDVSSIPGARALTGSMPVDRWAVVTSGTTALARARLHAAGITRPDVLVTADDVQNGKPDPEGYLAAAARLGLRADTTVVLEDALTGVRAARAAGVRAVIGVGGRGLDDEVDLVVPDLRALRWSDEGIRLIETP